MSLDLRSLANNLLSKAQSQLDGSFALDFAPTTMTVTTTPQCLFLPFVPTPMSWMGVTVRSVTGATYVYVGPLGSAGKQIYGVSSYYERGTDHRPVYAEQFYAWTDAGIAVIEIDGENW